MVARLTLPGENVKGGRPPDAHISSTALQTFSTQEVPATHSDGLVPTVQAPFSATVVTHAPATQTPPAHAVSALPPSASPQLAPPAAEEMGAHVFVASSQKNPALSQQFGFPIPALLQGVPLL